MSDVTMVELDQRADNPDRELQAVRQKRSCSPCMAKLDRLGWAVCDWFEVDDYRFGVRTTSYAFGEWIRYVLGHYLVDGPNDPDDDPLFSLVVEDPTRGSGRRSKSFHILYEGTLDVARSVDIRAVAWSFLGEVESITFPRRDDAVYLEASIIRGVDGIVLIPSLLAPLITAAGRRIKRATEIDLPSQLSVAMDPSSACLVPPRRLVDTPEDALDVLGGYASLGVPDALALVHAPVPVARILSLRMEPILGLGPASRGPVLFGLARSIRNFAKVGGVGLRTVARALSQADVVDARWSDTRQLVELVAAAVDGGRYVPGPRSRAAP